MAKQNDALVLIKRIRGFCPQEIVRESSSSLSHKGLGLQIHYITEDVFLVLKEQTCTIQGSVILAVFDS